MSEPTVIIAGDEADIVKCAGLVELTTKPSQWWKLPLALRQRWWTETDFGRKMPSDELKAAVQDALSVAADAKVL